MLWIVGNVFKDFRDYLQSQHIPYGVFINTSQRINPNLRDIEVSPLDFSSTDSLVASARAAAKSVDAIMVAGYENYVLPAAILAAEFGLPGLSVDAAKASTDKAIMRRKFQDFDASISPAYQAIDSWQDIESFMQQHRFPVMLKPTNLMKSLFVTRNDSWQELRRNYQQMTEGLAAINDTVYTMDAPEILIEECIVGSMHTVAGYADSNGNPVLISHIADCTTGYDVGKNENYLYSRQLPSRLAPEKQVAVLEVAARGVKALNLSNTMLHIELILTQDGPKIIEIGARTGGYRARMYAYAAGIDLNAIALDVAYGRRPKVESAISKSIAVIELFPDEEGNYAALTNQESLQSLQSLQYVHTKEPGANIGRSSHGYKAAAIIILGNDDPEQLANDYDYIRQNVAVKLQ